MHRYSLRDLITNDLADLAYLGSEVVASEEAIRCIMHVYQTKGSIKNVELIHIGQFGDYLKRFLDNLESSQNQSDDTPSTQFKHFQFFIEVGERSRIEQGQHGSIHYAALDLFLIPQKKPLAFLADHHHPYIYPTLEMVSKELNIDFIVMHGTMKSIRIQPDNTDLLNNLKCQNDKVHCPIFTITHLVQTAHDLSLLEMLDKMRDGTATSTPQIINLRLDQLSPDYLLQAQSLSLILEYIDTIKARDIIHGAVEQHEASNTLVKAEFADKLQQNLVWVKSKDSFKAQNHSIKYATAEVAGITVLKLEEDGFIQDNALINLCYEDRYPLLNQLLCQALSVEVNASELPHNQKHGAHPIFELAFNHASILENCLKNNNFMKIFSNENILILIYQERIDVSSLFNKLITKTNTVCVNAELADLVSKNLDSLAFLLHESPNCLFKPSAEELLDIIFKKTTQAFFQNQELAHLFKIGKISFPLLMRIQPRILNENTTWKSLQSDEEKINLLNTLYPEVIQTMAIQETDEEVPLDFDIFDLPPTTEAAAEPHRKPGIVPALLTQGHFRKHSGSAYEMKAAEHEAEAMKLPARTALQIYKN